MNKRKILDITNQALSRTGTLMQGLQQDLVRETEKTPEDALDVMTIHVAVLLTTARRAMGHAVRSGVDPLLVEQAAASMLLDSMQQERRAAIEVVGANGVTQ